jgi:hypothetical protein
MPTESNVSILSELLSKSIASPYAKPERLAPSALYDLDYRVCVICACFHSHAKSDEPGFKKINAARLKLLQFIAIRSWLLPVVKEWSESRDDPQRSAWSSQSLRRGFLGDAMHDEVIDYMVAGGLLLKAQSHLTTLGANSRVESIYNEILTSELFVRERKVLTNLENIRITNAMLEGW